VLLHTEKENEAMPYNEARQAQAYRELEADIRHLVRSAHIAA